MSLIPCRVLKRVKAEPIEDGIYVALHLLSTKNTLAGDKDGTASRSHNHSQFVIVYWHQDSTSIKAVCTDNLSRCHLTPSHHFSTYQSSQVQL